MICRSIISSKHASTARAALSPAAPGDSNPSSPAGSASRSAAAMHSAVDRNPGRGCFRMRYALSRRCPDEELESFPAVSPRSSPRSSPFPTPRDDPADGPSFGMDSPYCTLDVFSPSTYAGSSRTHGILLYIRLARCHVVSMTTRCLGGAPPASDDRSPSPGTSAPSSFDVARRSVAASGAGHSTPTSLFGRCLGLGTTSGTEVSNQTLVQSSSANSATMALPKGLFSASILSCSTVMPSLLSIGESPTMERTTPHTHSLWTLLHRQHISLPFGASESSASSASSPLEARGASGKGVSNPSFASFGRDAPSPVIPADPEAEAETVSDDDARPPLAPTTTVLSAAARTAELLHAIRSLHALAWSLDMPRALLPGDALVDTPTAALAIWLGASPHVHSHRKRDFFLDKIRR